MKVSRVARHYEEDDCIRPTGVVVVNECSDQIYNSVVLWESPGERQGVTLYILHGTHPIKPSLYHKSFENFLQYAARMKDGSRQIHKR